MIYITGYILYNSIIYGDIVLDCSCVTTKNHRVISTAACHPWPPAPISAGEAATPQVSWPHPSWREEVLRPGLSAFSSLDYTILYIYICIYICIYSIHAHKQIYIYIYIYIHTYVNFTCLYFYYICICIVLLSLLSHSQSLSIVIH